VHRAGGTKDFYGNPPLGERFDTRAWHGIEAYEPSELVITVRAGTPMREVEATLAAQRQMLAFEPPHFGDEATVGGCIAAGLSGPRRSSAGFTYGGVREAVLGARLLDGHGRLLRFGGTVIGSLVDVSRALVAPRHPGDCGCVAEGPACAAVESTLRFELGETQALDTLIGRLAAAGFRQLLA
jgi:glycolate oxidase FAD binding subunit